MMCRYTLNLKLFSLLKVLDNDYWILNANTWCTILSFLFKHFFIIVLYYEFIVTNEYYIGHIINLKLRYY